MSYFPMFVELKGEPCVVIGGGRIALRKVEVLRDFKADVTVIAPSILPILKDRRDIRCVERGWRETDIMDARLVVAATDEAAVNHEIHAYCQTQKIPVNAVDQVEDCNFIFSSYVKKGEVVAAFSSGGQSPVVTQYLKQQITPVMTDALGGLTACLGELRGEVKKRVPTETARKKVYQEILRLGLRDEEIPSREEIERTIQKYAKGETEDGTNKTFTDK